MMQSGFDASNVANVVAAAHTQFMLSVSMRLEEQCNNGNYIAHARHVIQNRETNCDTA